MNKNIFIFLKKKHIIIINKIIKIKFSGNKYIILLKYRIWRAYIFFFFNKKIPIYLI